MAARSRPTPARRWPRPDISALALAPLGLLLIVLAQRLEGVPVTALMQGPAALIVFGGTLGAVLITHSLSDVWNAIKAAALTFTKEPDDSVALSSTMLGFAIRAHRRGMAAVEQDLDTVTEPFLKDGLTQVVDETPLDMLRESLHAAADGKRLEDEAPARIFDAAAGYSPTLGILGAVIGLIRVMQNLAAPGALGGGIAVAFVATVYGVGVANLLLLPIAGRLRERAARDARRREMMIQGICGIHQRLHPRLVSQKLRTFTPHVPGIEEVAARMRPSRGTRLPA